MRARGRVYIYTASFPEVRRSCMDSPLVDGSQGICDSTGFSFSDHYQWSFIQSQSHRLQTLAQSAAVGAAIVAIGGNYIGATTATRAPGQGRVC